MPHENDSWIDILLMIGLAVLALALAINMALTVTERIPHLEDEIAYIYQARVFARGALWGPVPEQRSAFFTPFVLNLEDKRVGKYSIGWPLVLAIGEAAKAGWLVTPILGAAMVALIYRLGRDLFGRDVALVAGVLGATSPFFLLQSSTYMSHAAAALWVAVMLWGLRQAEKTRSRRWTAVSGLGMGMLMLTRSLTGIAIAVPIMIYLIARLIRERDVLAMIGLYWPLVLVAGLLATLQPLWLYVVTGSPTTNLYTMVWEYDRVGFGPEFGRVGHTLDQALYTSRQDLKLWTSELFGLRGWSWVLVVMGLVAGLRRKVVTWTLLLAGLFVCLVLAYMAYWIGARVYGPRYYYEAHIGLAILAGLGVREGVHVVVGGIQRLVDRGMRERPSEEHHADWGKVILAFVVGVLLALNLGGYLPERSAEWHGLYGITRAPIDELRARNGSQPAIVVVRGGRWRQYAPFWVLNSPWYDDPIIAAHDYDVNRLNELMVDYPDRAFWYYSEGEFSVEPFLYPYSDP